MRLFSVVQMHFLFLLLVPVLRTHCLIGFLSTGTAFFSGSAPVLTVPNTLPEIGVRKFPVCWFLVVESNQHHFTASSSSNWTSLNISFSSTDTIIAWLFFSPSYLCQELIFSLGPWQTLYVRVKKKEKNYDIMNISGAKWERKQILSSLSACCLCRQLTSHPPIIPIVTAVTGTSPRRWTQLWVICCSCALSTSRTLLELQQYNHMLFGLSSTQRTPSTFSPSFHIGPSQTHWAGCRTKLPPLPPGYHLHQH